MEIIKFGSIDTHRDHVRDIVGLNKFVSEAPEDVLTENQLKWKNKENRKVTYVPTFKMGGTNTSIVFHADGNITFQSRNRVITENDDQNGFVKYISQPKIMDELCDLVGILAEGHNDENVVLYGEWVGKGIKDKAAISRIETKTWFPFAVRVGGKFITGYDKLVKLALFSTETLRENNVRPVTDWQHLLPVDITIDYSDYPTLMTDVPVEVPAHLTEIADKYTLECPIAKEFGIEGIGEGLVLDSIGSSLLNLEWLKLKNSQYDKAPKHTEVKEVNPAKLKMQEFMSVAASESRLQQFIFELQREHETLTADMQEEYIQKVVDDVRKECTNLGNDLEITEEMWIKGVQGRATGFFKKALNTQ